MTPVELTAAAKLARFRCCECGSDDVRGDATPSGPVPVVTHWEVSPGTWCSATHGGLAARRASLDLLDALSAVIPLGQYGEPEPWHRRERVTT